MTDPAPIPDGYVVRCPCADLDPLTSGQAIKELAETQQCQTCGVVWTLHWRRDPGGETQPEWCAVAPAPKSWAPPTTPPPTDPADPG